MIDTLAHVETPEGVELEFSPAGPVPRALAWLLDALIRYTAYVLVLWVMSLLGKAGMGVFLVFLFLLEWGYPVVFEVTNKGQTPGKRALGLKVVREDGTPVGWSASMVRSLLACVDFLPFGYGTGLIAMFTGARFQRLGDLAAGTLVVHVAPRSAPRREAQGPAEPPMPLPFPLTLVEQRAIMSFSERMPTFTRERAEELAGILEPFTGARDGEGVRRLQALARELRGHA